MKQKTFSSGFKFLTLIIVLSAVVFAISQEKGIPDLGTPVLVHLSGTGSMYPTFPKGTGKSDLERSKEKVASVPMYRYSSTSPAFTKILTKNSLYRGDIIYFKNAVTESLTQKQYGQPSGLVKRAIALPGDVVEIRDGLVFLNSVPLIEPYTAQARSTFGGQFLPECKPITVPERHVFALGDNRKGSEDSRHEIGFIPLSDILYVLPFKNQKGRYDTFWRDASKDLDSQSKPKINSDLYLSLLNKMRLEEGKPPLKKNPKLSQAAKLRGEIMLKYNDFSYEATKSGYTQTKAMSQVNYWNPIRGETWLIGYYTAEELIENQLEFPNSKKFLYDSQFQDFGLAEVEGLLNDCPAQVIVQHFAGYVPPNYQKEVIHSWQSALDQLKKIQPEWNLLKTTGPFYDQHKYEIDRINEIIDIRISRISSILSTMTANKWLSSTESKWIDEDSGLAQEFAELATRINSR